MLYGGVGFLLLTAAAGYWVLERASKHKGELQKVGYFLGSIILVVSLLGVTCQIWKLSSGGGYHGKRAYMQYHHGSR